MFFQKRVEIKVGENDLKIAQKSKRFYLSYIVDIELE